jgi:hypothetical protein
MCPINLAIQQWYPARLDEVDGMLANQALRHAASSQRNRIQSLCRQSQPFPTVPCGCGIKFPVWSPHRDGPLRERANLQQALQWISHRNSRAAVER